MTEHIPVSLAIRAVESKSHATPYVRKLVEKLCVSCRQAIEIFKRAWSGEKHAEIASDFGVSSATVGNIKTGHSWASVTGANDATAPGWRTE